MAGRPIYNPDAFQNEVVNGEIVGFSFEFKAQYYRGFTLSLIRDIRVNVDGEDMKREDIRFTVNDATFTMEEMRTVVDPDYRWEYGDFAKVTVLKPGGLAKGKHHIVAHQSIAPSYMPFTIEEDCVTDFEI